MIALSGAFKVQNAAFTVSRINKSQRGNVTLETALAICKQSISTLRADFVNFTLKILHVSDLSQIW